jgi:hypothetical protein
VFPVRGNCGCRRFFALGPIRPHKHQKERESDIVQRLENKCGIAKTPQYGARRAPFAGRRFRWHSIYAQTAYAAASTAAGRASAGLPFFFRPAAESRDENDVYLNVHKL